MSKGQLRVLSLFAGIGGMDLGLERAGMTVVGQVEIDPYCQRVLAKHWPDVWRWDDVRTLTSETVKANCGDIDLICGGFPCQDISNAGKRAGIDGERSGLWSEFHRLICELRPRYALVENVAALLVRGVDRVLGDLAASGYGAEWDCVPAAAVGAPHIRDRLFVVAYAESMGRPAWSGEPGDERRAGRGRCQPARSSEVLAVAGCERSPSGLADSSSRDEGNSTEFVYGGAHVADAGHGALSERARSPRRQIWQRPPERGEFGGADWWSTEPNVGRVAHGVPARVDRLRGLGNAVVPQVAEYVGRLIVESLSKELT